VAKIRSQTVYMLACGQCGDGKDVIAFGSLSSRIDWMREHGASTGHDGYLVQDIERLVAEGQCPLCNAPLDVDPVAPEGRDERGDRWLATRCEEHGAWGRRDDGVLVPVLCD
jgi:hypothetical protein